MGSPADPPDHDAQPTKCEIHFSFPSGQKWTKIGPEFYHPDGFLMILTISGALFGPFLGLSFTDLGQKSRGGLTTIWQNPQDFESDLVIVKMLSGTLRAPVFYYIPFIFPSKP